MPFEKLFLAVGKSGQVGLDFCRRVISLTHYMLIWAVALANPVDATVTKNNPEIAGLCDRAAVKVALASDVPLDVLLAISRTETGRPSASGLQPWPWTVNMEGTGRWFATLDEARSYVFLHFKNGARSFDVGCFQINYKWHGEAFRSIDDMFDPLLNAQYAAQFLSELYREFGNWPDAAGAYHSRTQKLANKYSTRFDRIRAGLSGGSELALAFQGNDGRVPNTASRDIRQNQGPRPLTAGQVALGSLVPIMRKPGASLRPFVTLK